MARFVAMRLFAGAAAVGLLGSCGDGGSGSGAPPVSITAASASVGTAGAVYPGYTLIASGGAPPYSWTESGVLPPAVRLSTSGQLSGTSAIAGTYPISVTAADSSMPPLAARAPVSLKINATRVVVAAAPSPPAGKVNNAYPAFGFSASGGSPPYTWQSSATVPPGLTLASDGTVSGTPIQPGLFSFSVTATDSAQTPMSGPPLATQILINNSPSLTFTLLSASMTKPRTGHTATLLNTGHVLIAGGWNGSADEASAELYDPAAGTFTATVGPMTEARRGHTATLLNASLSATYAKVLIAGSADKVDVTAELYNPATGLFARTGSMTRARQGATATLLNSGKVLIVGGNTTTGDKTAELYNPATGTFSVTGSTLILRIGHTATLLSDGSVLIAGGSGTTLDYGEWATATAERYYPATGTFTATGSMTVARTGHTATRLGAKDGTQNGEVLIVGIEGSADLYSPVTGKFTAVGGYWDASAHSASLRNDGTVLVAGGNHQVPTYLRVTRGLPSQFYCVAGPTWPYSTNAAALFTYATDGFAQTGALSRARDGHTATVLADGSVLIAGGTYHIVRWPSPYYCPITPAGSATVLSSAELFK